MVTVHQDFPAIFRHSLMMLINGLGPTLGIYAPLIQRSKVHYSLTLKTSVPLSLTNLSVGAPAGTQPPSHSPERGEAHR
jgi:hypothetical protein